jgi:hypothetical protein
VLAAVLGPDCEAYRDAVLGQPASTVSSLAFVAVGVWCWYRAAAPRARRLELVVFGAVTILVGLGSIAFHGPHPSWSQWAHDVTIAWLLLLAIVLDVAGHTRRRGRGLVAWILGCVVLGVLFWAVPEGQRVVYTLLGATLVLLEAATVRRHGRPWPGDPGFALYAFAVGAFLVGTATFFLGRIDAWCDPGSWVQGHAIWHVLLAVALAAYVEVTLLARDA